MILNDNILAALINRVRSEKLYCLFLSQMEILENQDKCTDRKEGKRTPLTHMTENLCRSSDDYIYDNKNCDVRDLGRVTTGQYLVEGM